jgi:hypothetical protein
VDVTAQQIAVNHAVVTAEAERLEEQGYRGDAHRYVEQLLLRALSAGYRPLEPPAPRVGTGSTPEARAAALEAAQRAVDAAKRARTTAPTT